MLSDDGSEGGSEGSKGALYISYGKRFKEEGLLM